MVQGGDINKALLLESFSKIRQDIEFLNSEINLLKEENKRLIEENKNLRSQQVTRELVIDIVHDILSTRKRERVSSLFANKINKKRKMILQARIEAFAEQKRLTLSEIKDIIVEHEGLCSKATFYRYIDNMRNKGIIELAKINEREIVVRVQRE